MEYNINNIQNQSFFNRILRSITSIGINYDNEAARNTLGFGKNEDPYAVLGEDNFSIYARRAMANILNQKDIPYLQQNFQEKQRILYEYSTKIEIATAIERIADECIIYNENDFCHPRPLSLDYPQEVHDKYREVFEKVYHAYGFDKGTRAWEMMKQFLISGYKTFQMVWNDKKTEIVAFHEMPSETLVPQYDAYNNVSLWFQYPDDPTLITPFLDSQIVHISYANGTNISSLMSYTEGLIRPYNQLKLLEQTRIMFNIINASVHQQFTIPTQGMGKKQAQQDVAELIAEHLEHVEWDDSMGTVKMRGSKHLPFYKQFWFPETEHGSPKVDIMSPEGHDLNEDTILNWFRNIFKEATRIPKQRDEDGGGGGLFQGDGDMTRDENDFAKFTGRIKACFKELIEKPIKLMMLVEFPEYINDKVFLNQLGIDFNKDDLFEEWKSINILTKKVDVISNLLSLQRTDEKPYLHIDFVTEKLVRFLTKEQLEENQLYWARADKQGNVAQGGGNEGGDFGGSSGDMGSDFGGGDFGGGSDSPDDFGGGSPDIDTDTGGDEPPSDI
jgi:hypothetical protein